jgi:hypothetical protein
MGPSIITEEKPLAMQSLHSSKLSPWSRCSAMWDVLPELLGEFDRPLCHVAQQCLIGNLRAPELTWRMTERDVSTQAWMMAWSMLHVVEVIGGKGVAALHGLLNISLVLTSPSSL